jgi:TRAP-type mannitol/chloroaromatic compound transport system permease small subunit
MPHSRVVPSVARISERIDSFSEWTGRAVAWLVLLMVLIIVYDISMRYLFQIGSVALQELEWHLFALVFLLGAAYTLKHDGHVRVDILYQSRWMSRKRRAWVDLFGTVFFLLPFAVLIIVSSLPFVSAAYNIGEGSPDPGGLPYRYLLKAAIPVGFGLLILQGVSNALRCMLVLMGKEESAAPSPDNSES